MVSDQSICAWLRYRQNNQILMENRRFFWTLLVVIALSQRAVCDTFDQNQSFENVTNDDFFIHLNMSADAGSNCSGLNVISIPVQFFVVVNRTFL